MKRIRINTGFLGLVFNNKDYVKVIEPGTHWLKWGETVLQYDIRAEFKPPVAVEILLQDTNLEERLEVVDVTDNEIVILFENDRFKTVLTPGRYLFWKGLVNRSFTRADLSKIYITEPIDKGLFSKYELSKHIRIFEVAAYEKALFFVDDVYSKTLGPGTYRFWKNDTSIKIAKVDLRQKMMEMSGQELLTQDKAAVRINFYTQYKVVDMEKALLDNKDYDKQLYTSMQLVLRAFVGSYTLDGLLENKDLMAEAVFNAVKTKAKTFGVAILECGIRDIILTGDMKAIMNQVLVAQKKAQANTIMRREETAATRSLLNTAKLMEENSMLFKLKEMEYVEKIADKIGEITLHGNGNMMSQLKSIFSGK